MRILWVKAGGLVPLDTGGKTRSFQILKQLALRHEVTLYTFYRREPDDQHAELRSLFSRVVTTPLPLPAPRSVAEYLQYAGLLLMGRPATIEKYFLYPEVRRDFTALIASQTFDVVVCDFIYPARVIDWDLSCPKILFTHNVEAQVWSRHALVTSNPLRKLACRLESRALMRAERHYAQLADYVVTVSANDQAFFTRCVPPTRTAVIPTGVDVEYFRANGAPEEPHSLVFTGSMDWLPNDDAVRYFVGHVLPLVRREVPDARFWAVGRRPLPALRALASEGVTVTGTVDDIRPYLDRGAVCVVPLRSGSGTRIKIFEAMAMGKSVVSTTLGAEGLPVTHDRDILLADSPEEFARAIVALLRDPARRRRLGGAARELVERNHSWAAVGTQFEAILASVWRSIA
jgi:sugar transferase (PEP-CTERM/EpsH1 system associated)